MRMTAREAIKQIEKNIALIRDCDCTEYDMAINALEKQIPKKPIEYEDKYYGCPACGNPVMHKWEKCQTVLNDKKNGLPYCLGCGQALDWEENPKD